MPFELGVDVGCHEYGGRRFHEKKILIFESERYHYQKVLSDIAGQDIYSHENDPQKLIKKLRDWLSAVDDVNDYPSHNVIWLAYNRFFNSLTKKLTADGYTSQDISEMPVGDFIKFARKWIPEYKKDKLSSAITPPHKPPPLPAPLPHT